MAALMRVEGHCRAIEVGFEAAKNELGLDHNKSALNNAVDALQDPCRDIAVQRVDAALDRQIGLFDDGSLQTTAISRPRVVRLKIDA